MSEKRAKYKVGDKAPAVRFMLSELLESRGINKTAAAEKIGISHSAIFNLTSQPKAVRLDTLTKICEAFDITPGALFKMDD